MSFPMGCNSGGLPNPGFSLAQFTPPYIIDQGPISSMCWSCVTVGAIYTSFAAQGRPLPWVPSPYFLGQVGYGITRAQNASYVPGASVPRLLDTGGGGTANAAVAVFGIKPMGQFNTTPVAYTSDIIYSLSNVVNEPTISDLEIAAQTLVGGFTVSHVGDYASVTALANYLAAALQSNAVPIIAFASYPVFDTWAGGDAAIPYPAAGTPFGVGHLVFLDRWRPDGFGGKDFHFVNSYQSFNNGTGLGWVSTAWLAILTSINVCLATRL